MFTAHTIHHDVQFNRWVTVAHHLLQLSGFLYSIYASLSLKTISLVTTRTSGKSLTSRDAGKYRDLTNKAVLRQ